jgi:hypothetical protein
MAKYEITAPDGSVYEVEAPDAATEQEVLSYAQSQFKKPAPVLNQTPIPSVTEGMSTGERLLAGIGQGMTSLGRGVGQRLGMVSEEDVARARELDRPLLETGAGLTGSIIGGVAPALPTAFIPGVNTYTGAAALGGVMGALQPTVKGESPITNAAVGAPAGMLGQFAGNKIVQGLSPIASKVKNILTRPSVQTTNLNIKIDNALRPTGIKFGDLAAEVQNTIKADVDEALKISPDLSGDSLRRLIDYRVTGTTPRTAQLTLDPAAITQQKNLAKLGVNSNDIKAQQLAQVENQNNQVLLSKLDDLGAANSTGDLYDAGKTIFDSIDNFATTEKTKIGNLYNQAQGVGGRTAEYDAVKFVNQAGSELDKNVKSAFLPNEIKNILNQISKGELPLNVQTAEQLKTILSTSQRSATDGNVRQALGLVRDALENTPLKPNQSLGEQALKSFNEARKANFQFKNLEKKTSILKDINAGVEPDKLFEKHVIRSNINDFKNMLSILDPNAKAQLKNDVVAYMKNAATNSQPNETARLSSDQLNKFIAKNNQKLAQIFTKDELQLINSIKNVAKYESVQPVGSAVNNSNTAAGVLSILDRASKSSVLSKIPFGESAIGQPLREINLSIQSGRALNVPRGIVTDVAQRPLRTLLSPITGLLSSEMATNQ